MKAKIFKASILSGVFPVFVAALMSSCATAPVPNVLLEARASLLASNTGLAANLAPRYLDDAKQALERANQEFATHGDDAVCRDYSYIAENKFELADVIARAELERQALGEGAAPKDSLRSEEARPRAGRSLASAR
jgi:hypothetical protein